MEFRETHEIAAYTIMSEAYDVPVGELRETIKGNVFPDLKENREAFEEAPHLTSLYVSGKFISDFFIRKGIINQPVDLDKLHAPEIVNEIES